MRHFSVLFLVGTMAGGGAHAATIESYNVEASARLTLTSALFDGGGDAAGFLSITYSLDQLDDFPQSSGNATVDTNFARNDATGTFAVATSGTAGPPFGSSTGRVTGRLAQISGLAPVI